MTTFKELKLSAPLLRALDDEGYARPTPIQAKAIPAVRDGADVLGLAQTGSGKTAAFTLPMLMRLAESGTRPAARSARALVLTPTRELAAQIGEAVRVYGRHLRLSHTVIFGGVGQGPQVRAMQRGVDILIATPGRLMDLMNQGRVRLDSVEFFVLDEADRMLDLGFIQPIRKISAALPAKRQTLLFSATMPAEIARLAASVQHDPVRIEIARAPATQPKIAQQVLFVDKGGKRALLEKILSDTDVERALVFTRTKRGADRVMRGLDSAGLEAAAIHGNKSQGARETALKGFRQGRVRVLVATDIAARGIDVDGISHVINFDMPDTPEAYVHRIGRTARAGAAGTALSFCDGGEVGQLRDIERSLGEHLPVHADHANRNVAETAGDSEKTKSRSTQNRRRGQRSGNGPDRQKSAEPRSAKPAKAKRSTGNGQAQQARGNDVGVMRTLFRDRSPGVAAGERQQRGRGGRPRQRRRVAA